MKKNLTAIISAIMLSTFIFTGLPSSAASPWVKKSVSLESTNVGSQSVIFVLKIDYEKKENGVITKKSVYNTFADGNSDGKVDTKQLNSTDATKIGNDYNTQDEAKKIADSIKNNRQITGKGTTLATGNYWVVSCNLNKTYKGKKYGIGNYLFDDSNNNGKFDWGSDTLLVVRGVPSMMK